MRNAAITALLITVMSAALAAQAVRGVVTDSSGATVAGADVALTSAASPQHTTTQRDGSFAFEHAAPPATLTIAQPGFAPANVEWKGEARLDVVLRPATLQQQIVVTATRGAAALGDVAAAVTHLDRAERDAAPPLVLDNVLRQAPGFSLFRRSDSRTA